MSQTTTYAETPATRTLTIVLAESEWQALRTAEPDAIGWLQERIRERLRSSGAGEALSGTGASNWDDDEY